MGGGLGDEGIRESNGRGGMNQNKVYQNRDTLRNPL
jgi:hypothetical protein